MRNAIPQKLIILVFFALFSCEKENFPPVQPPSGKNVEITFHNEFSEIAAKYAAWLSDADGKTLVFRWLNGNDSTQLVFKNFPENQPAPELHLAKITVVDGLLQKDTTVEVSTFANLNFSETIRLRNQNFRRTTTVNLNFLNVASVDTIIVPDGLTFARPGWWNNFNGIYSVEHTGSIWLRAQFNGDPHWKFVTFNNVQGENLIASLDASQMPVEEYPKPLKLPFVAAWKYKVEGILSLDNQEFIPLGDLTRAPGGAVPVFDKLDVFEPIPFDPIAPPLPYSSYRLKFSGEATDGKSYLFDQILNAVPTELPTVNFDLQKTVLGDNRLASLTASGSFDCLVLSRKNAGQPALAWQVFLKPEGSVTHRLPDVPDELGKIFPGLKNYDFGQKVRARGEAYHKLTGFREVLDVIFKADDPLWQAKCGLIGREIPL